jgi:hypothetical protein
MAWGYGIAEEGVDEAAKPDRQMVKDKATVYIVSRSF